MADSRIILVTGANQGIGYEIVRQLASQGHIVYLGSRNAQRGKEALDKLEKEGIKSAHFIELDVTKQATIDAAAKVIAQKHSFLDVLVNNAGIILSEGENPNPVDCDVEEMKATYDTNVFGVMRMTKAFVPLLKKSKNPVICNVSSGLGSCGLMTMENSPVVPEYLFPGYNTSKSALNSYTITVGRYFKEARVNVVSPGHISTNLNHFDNHNVVPVEPAVAGVIKNAILIDQSGPTCKFLDCTEVTWPW